MRKHDIGEALAAAMGFTLAIKAITLQDSYPLSVFWLIWTFVTLALLSTETPSDAPPDS